MVIMTVEVPARTLLRKQVVYLSLPEVLLGIRWALTGSLRAEVSERALELKESLFVQLVPTPKAAAGEKRLESVWDSTASKRRMLECQGARLVRVEKGMPDSIAGSANVAQV
jgi:hypothetical protein